MEKKNKNICDTVGTRTVVEGPFEVADLMWDHQSLRSTGPWRQVKVISSLLMGLFTLDPRPLVFHNSSFIQYEQYEIRSSCKLMCSKWKVSTFSNAFRIDKRGKKRWAVRKPNSENSVHFIFNEKKSRGKGKTFLPMSHKKGKHAF